MLAAVSIPRKLARPVGERIKCDSYSMLARATRLIAGASGAALDGGVRFLGEFSIMAGAFSTGQVINFESMVYVADCYDELNPLKKVTPTGNEPPTPPSLLGLLGEDLEVLT
jgi:hypothetical protein